MNVLDKIFQTIDLRILITNLGIELSRRNDKWSRGRCPFHDDVDVPNLDVGSNYFRCFACGEHGSIIDFVSRYYNISKYRAVNKLCEGDGIKQGKFKSKQTRKIKKTLKPDLELIKEVLWFIINRTSFVEGKAKEYLNGRGLSNATIRKAKLRYIKYPNRLIKMLRKKYPVPILKQLHLLNENDNFVLYYHRILFPYFYKNEPVFMQGRSIDETKFKLNYLNVGETIPYPYNIDDVDNKKQKIFIAEGVMDALSLMQRFNKATG